MENPADLTGICKLIVEYVTEGSPVKDVIEQTPYSETELIYELALAYLSKTHAMASDRTGQNHD